MKVQYYAASSTMGDISDSDYEAYCKWAKVQIEEKYKNAQVEVLNEDNLNISAWTADYSQQEEVNKFCNYLWDRCPWDFYENA